MRRADSVRKILADEFSVKADRIETDGKGESEPISGNNTPEGKALNRRVGFIRL
jgi:outer membrane protein OmpA-like peptidoglycan-associated protein